MAQAFSTPEFGNDPYLQGNYAPIDSEISASNLTVKGELPRELNGCYVRTGSNPRFAPKGAYHWFDGDGMLHATHFQNGRANYVNRFVRTAGLKSDELAGTAQWTGIQEKPDFRHEGGPFKDTSNTDLVFHAGQLLSLWWLSGKAHAVSLPECETLGVQDWGGALQRNISAHPKLDPRTGELVFFDYAPFPPYLIYGVISPDGKVVHQEPIDLPGPRLQHDTAITQNHTLFFDMSMMYDPTHLMAGELKLGFFRDKPSRIGVVPRRGSNADVRWFETAPFFMYHTINAWEEGDEIVLVGCRIDNPVETDPLNPSCAFTVPALGGLRLEPYLWEWRLNLATGDVRERQLDDVMTEFPRTNNDLLGSACRYTYNPRVARIPTLAFDGLIRYDLEAATSSCFEYPSGWYGGETTFAPRAGAEQEDDGWVLTYASEDATGQSELWVFDAQEVSQGPVARVQIPQRVPYGYHTWWISAQQLAGQRPL